MGVALEEPESRSEEQFRAGAGESAIRFPEIDNAADGEIGMHLGITAGEAGGRAAGSEHPVANGGTHRIHRHAELALGGAQDSQIHVAQPVDPMGANQGTGHLHDFHQALPPLAVAAADAGAALLAKTLAASGSQWSMMPTMVRSLG